MLDKSRPAVASMFGEIAHSYDFLNGFLSLNQDSLWRRRAVKRLCPRPGERILDLCCGTGDLALEIARQNPHCRIVGADFAPPMLQIAQTKNCAHFPVWMAADALRLPFENASFDAVSVGFGVRNFENTRVGMEEIFRVLKPGGRVLVLEFMRPTSPLLQRFFALFNTFFAPVGRKISGHGSAYNYLPQSVGGFYTRREFSDLLREVGFCNVRSFQHSLGVATSFLAVKSP